MKTILLAAGFGTRLYPITKTIPKALVEVKGKPLLEIWLENLAKSNLNEILINTHYLHEKVRNFINKSQYKNNIILKYEEILLGTAGTLRANIDFINEDDVLLIHADNYCTCDLLSFVNAHNSFSENCTMTMMSFRTTNPQSCGIIKVNKKNIITNFYEKSLNPHGNLANGAVYILKNELVKEIVKNKYNDFSIEVIPTQLGKILNYENKDVHIDIGTPEMYKLAQEI